MTKFLQKKKSVLCSESDFSFLIVLLEKQHCTGKVKTGPHNQGFFKALDLVLRLKFNLGVG